jgi:hypothetical protein
MAAPDFWANKDRAQVAIDESTALRAKVLPLEALIQKVEDLAILKTLAEEEADSQAQLSACGESGGADV